MHPQTICAGIVTFNSQDHLEPCLRSLAAQTHPVDEIHIFDNASLDWPLHMIQNLVAQIPGLPSTYIHKSPVNLGFGQAHNRILEHWNGTFYLMLNPDVVLAPEFVRKALEIFTSDSQIASVNGQIRYQDGKIPSPYIYSLGHVLYRDRRFEDLAIGQHSETLNIPTRHIFGPNGACPVLLVKALRDVSYPEGPFDKAYFLYGEDDDLNWRLALAGWKSLYVPQCLAWHDAGSSGGFRSGKARRSALANRWLTIVKNDHPLFFLLDSPIILGMEFLYWGIRLIKRPAFFWDLSGAFFLFLRHLPHAWARRRQTPIRLSLREERQLFEPGMFKRLRTLGKRVFGKNRHRSLWTKAEQNL